MLSQEDQPVFMALAIFRDGFRRHAAQAVAGAGLSVLVAVVEKSLVSLSETGRYSMHELLRQFALEKMADNPSFEEAVKTQFSDHYLDFLESLLTGITTPHQDKILSEMAEEIDNVQLVWNWALDRNDLTLLERAIHPYTHYLWVRDRGHTGLEIVHHALHMIQQSEQARLHPRYLPLHQSLLKELGAFSYFVGDLDGAANYLRQAEAEARKPGEKRTLSSSRVTLGTVYLWLGRPDDAAEKIQSAIDLVREIGDIVVIANANHELSRVSMLIGDYQTAREQAEESLF